jgi:hypothetical protein
LTVLQNVLKTVLEMIFFRFGIAFTANKLFYTITAFFEVTVKQMIEITIASLLLGGDARRRQGCR